MINGGLKNFKKSNTIDKQRKKVESLVERKKKKVTPRDPLRDLKNDGVIHKWYELNINLLTPTYYCDLGLQLNFKVK